MNHEPSNMRQVAIESLQNITAMDPLYKPARFFLAYAKLLEGEAKLAAEMFASITTPINKEAELIFQEVKEKWGLTGIRWFRLIALAKPIGIARLLEPWIELWQEISSHLLGGFLYRCAQMWNKFNQAKQLGNTHLIKLYVPAFSYQKAIQEYVEIAAGLTSSNVSADKAHKILDLTLDEHTIYMFDFQLYGLELKLGWLKIDRQLQDLNDVLEIPEKPLSHEDGLFVIHQLHNSPVGWIFKLALEKLEKLWQAEDWTACEKLLKTLRDFWTRFPSDFEAGSLLLRALKLPKMSGLLIRFFIPAYTLLDQWHATFRHTLFLESEFYYALSKYQEFTRLGLVEAMERAFSLHDLLLTGSAPMGMNARRHSELRLLARCLEACAAVRVALNEQSDPEYSAYKANNRLRELLESNSILLSDLSRTSTDRLVESNLRVTAFNTLGLLERYQYRLLEQYGKDRPGNVRKPSKAEREQVARELGYFLKALDSKRSPDTCFYIAESLSKIGQTSEAQLYLDEALRLCPNHAGALPLRQQLFASMEGIGVMGQEKQN